MKRSLVSLLALSLATACAPEGGDGDPPIPVDMPDAAAGAGGEGGGAGGEGGGAGGEGGGAGGEGGGAGGEGGTGGVAILGGGRHTLDAVDHKVIGTAADGLDVPRDLAFNPQQRGELWVVNRADDSTSIFIQADSERQTSAHIVDPFALHFMDEVSSIAFGVPYVFGTCQESRNTYNNQAPANDFMGPALWSADPAIYGQTNPAAVDFVGADLGSHLDMLHETPLCMGMAWERANAYWIFEGLTSSIMKADFVRDHGPGFDDHSDGRMWRYGIGDVQRLPDVPSHLELDRDSGLLFIADTGNGRVATFDTTVGGEDVERLPVIEPGTRLWAVNDHAPIETFGTTADDLVHPSGIALGPDGLVYISDNATGRIWAYDRDGQAIDWLDTGLPEGALMGIEFRPDNGDLYYVDALGDQVLRIRAR